MPKKYFTYYLIAIVTIYACVNKQKNNNAKIEDVAGNEEVLNYMKTFAGRGELTDSSLPLDPETAASSFRVAGDLAFDLVLSEPEITQPLFLNFDERGRLWVVQYNQYPYPAGLKVTSIDQHLRSTFDKELPPPPEAAEGASRISIFEDADGDGKFEKSTAAITGLNLPTSVATGMRQVWVLDPPYLLAYPDPDNDGIPNGKPVVELKGFGIEDTHAVANSLRWGPDGWLYGAQGSTCTADVSSSVSKNIRFSGQAVWRYRPQSHVFEIYAEGGGNTFDLEIDEKGRFYSGDNGYSHGQYYKQGAYYPRNFGKHGALSNPYAFGHLGNMINKGEEMRFTHAFVKYEGGNLPARYQHEMIALNPLQRYVQLINFEPNGSSFINIDKEKIIQTDDRWFRPVDLTSGPDGAVYVADWYDSRISHVDPRDTWNKNTGRIYRLRGKNSKAGYPAFDLNKYSIDQLIGLMSDKNIWFRQQALRQFSERKDISVVSKLLPLLQSKDGQLALEALWAIHLSGGFNESMALIGLHHNDPFVRMWSVRLIGDSNIISHNLSIELAILAAAETNPEVRSQLAATVKRLPAPDAIPVIKNLLMEHDDSHDPDIPLQIWWAIESKAQSGRNEVVSMFEDKGLWNSATVNKTILSRLMQRYVIAGGDDNFNSCARLLQLAPLAKQGGELISGLQEGLRGREATQLPPVLLNALKPYQNLFREESLALNLRQGQQEAVERSLDLIADKNAALGQRLSVIHILGEVKQPKAVPVLLNIMGSNESSPAIQQAALLALQRYDDEEIGKRVVAAYPDILRADPDVRAAALALCAARPSWAKRLLNAIDRKKEPGENFIGRTIDKNDVPDQIVMQLNVLGDQSIIRIMQKIWPEVKISTSPEKNTEISRVKALMKTGKGNMENGHKIFQTTCGPCHQLFNEGGKIGPDLTGYDRTNRDELLINIVDPSAYIREGFASYHLITDDGRTLMGTIKSRSGPSLTIQPFSGEAVTLHSNVVKDMQQQKSSIMPERLLQTLNDQQVRDLMSYLMRQ